MMEEDETTRDGVVTSVPPPLWKISSSKIPPFGVIHGWCTVHGISLLGQPSQGNCTLSCSDGKTSTIGQGQQRGPLFNSYVL